MLPKLAKLIQNHPWVVVTLIILITIGFSIFIPSLQFKTDFEEFMPEDELVDANNRIQEYFGQTEPLIIIRLEKENSENVITPNAIHEIQYIQNNLEKNQYVNGSFSIVTFLDTVCFIEFGKSINECSDEQIKIALNDLLTKPEITQMKIFENDPNEEIDYKRFPKISKGKNIDSADIKNCYIEKTNESLIFTIEVYDLSDLGSTITPVFPKINVMEWFVTFNNTIKPIKELDITYTIAAHIEPENPIWELGVGFLNNIKEIINNIRNRSLLNSYKKDLFLWIKPYDQDLSIPIPLESGEIEFIENKNQIQMEVSLTELGKYGIATQIGSLTIPAKLSYFTAGTRYYQTPILKLGGARLSANTSYIINKLLDLQSKPLLGNIAQKMLNTYGNLTWEEFDEFYEMINQYNMLPETIALKDIESSWIQSDYIPDNKIPSQTSFSIIPVFYQDLQSTVLSLLPKDFNKNQNPSSTLIFLNLMPTRDHDTIIKMNTEIVNSLTKLDSKYNYVSAEATGNGIVSVQYNEITIEANQFIAPAIFIIIVAVLFFNFRRFSYVILPMFTLVISTIWLFGTMVILDIPFNMISVALVPLILGLGVDYSVHILHNYRVELEKGKPPYEAIKNSVLEIGTAMFLAMITTVIAFLSFLTATVPPIRDFGLLLALGVIYTFITSLTLLGALRYLLDKNISFNINRKIHGLVVRKIMGLLSKQILKFQKFILIFIIILTIVFASGAINIETGFDIEEFAPPNTPAYILYDIIAEEFPFSSQSQEYILLEGNIASVELLEGIRKTHDNIVDDTYVAKNNDGSIKVTSIYSIIKQAVKNNESLIERFNMNKNTCIPSTDSDVKSLFDYLYKGGSDFNIESSIEISLDSFDSNESFLPYLSMDSYSNEIQSLLFKKNNDYKATIIQIFINPGFSTMEGKTNERQEVLKNEIDDDIASYGSVKATSTGSKIISLKITSSLTDSQVISTAVSLILASLVLIIVYRNLPLGLIALIPVGLSIIWILGTMFFIGYSLNVLTITVTSITIGIGIDYAIHATERFRLIVDKTGDITKAVCETISHTGGALLIAALTTALGFGILVFAPIPPQQQFGLILAITISYSFFTSIFVLPLVLYQWAKRRLKKKGYVVSKNNK
jgi:predicted RND superfamily exporter protein